MNITSDLGTKTQLEHVHIYIHSKVWSVVVHVDSMNVSFVVTVVGCFEVREFYSLKVMTLCMSVI